MPSETSSGAIIFRKEEGKTLYLLLQYNPEYWGFPKGRIEESEDEEKAARREIEEETGLKDISFFSGFREFNEYFFKRDGKTFFKKAIFRLVETKTKEINVSEEHLGFKWLPFQEALEQITFENAKEVLKKADRFLSEKGI
jgi:8-oxo-dGTP pyrophosphatase MutT (NUDIX family)